MTGGDMIALSRKALDWARADRTRRDHLAEVREAEAIARKKRASKKSKARAFNEREAHRKIAARAAGFRRGLVRECERVLAKGLD